MCGFALMPIRTVDYVDGYMVEPTHMQFVAYNVIEVGLLTEDYLHQQQKGFPPFSA